MKFNLLFSFLPVLLLTNCAPVVLNLKVHSLRGECELFSSLQINENKLQANYFCGSSGADVVMVEVERK